MKNTFKKMSTIILCSVLFLTVASSAYATEGNQRSQEKSEQEIHELFKQHAEDLQLSESERYKEVVLEDEGIILFNSVTVTKQPTINAKQGIVEYGPQATQTYVMTSSQGAKALFGNTLYQLDYNTNWTFDQNTVISSYSWASVLNGFGWSHKYTTSNGPGILDSGRTHEWAGTAAFAITVAGIDVSNTTLINRHRVRHNGTYAWTYDQTG
ncbi:hypothetical protein [Paenibacillus sp. PAMC21692]|uniref:hypothetical protein n=1 Tax=Paenibacillus sp. PAMC21692 TaxID=2762320 RepID=UPI00164D693D|nr:hypothetical protein [Paenibacillus sp. PAMC21692]QNK57768.1 hypothetical protein H7F31_02020 [Paenibacillus sp. PAMC21692]